MCPSSLAQTMSDMIGDVGAPCGPEVLECGNVVAAGIVSAMGRPYGWGVGFMFADLQQAMELWISIAGISGLDD